MVALCVASTTKVVVKVPARDAAAPAAARAPAFAPRVFLEKVRADPRVTDVAFRPRVQPNILFRKRIVFVLSLAQLLLFLSLVLSTHSFYSRSYKPPDPQKPSCLEP